MPSHTPHDDGHEFIAGGQEAAPQEIRDITTETDEAFGNALMADFNTVTSPDSDRTATTIELTQQQMSGHPLGARFSHVQGTYEIRDAPGSSMDQMTVTTFSFTHHSFEQAQQTDQAEPPTTLTEVVEIIHIDGKIHTSVIMDDSEAGVAAAAAPLAGVELPDETMEWLKEKFAEKVQAADDDSPNTQTSKLTNNNIANIHDALQLMQSVYPEMRGQDPANPALELDAAQQITLVDAFEQAAQASGAVLDVSGAQCRVVTRAAAEAFGRLNPADGMSEVILHARSSGLDSREYSLGLNVEQSDGSHIIIGFRFDAAVRLLTKNVLITAATQQFEIDVMAKQRQLDTVQDEHQQTMVALEAGLDVVELPTDVDQLYATYKNAKQVLAAARQRSSQATLAAFMPTAGDEAASAAIGLNGPADSASAMQKAAELMVAIAPARDNHDVATQQLVSGLQTYAAESGHSELADILGRLLQKRQEITRLNNEIIDTTDQETNHRYLEFENLKNELVAATNLPNEINDIVVVLSGLQPLESGQNI